MSGLDWPGLMRAGLHELRLPPDTFWALTPRELSLMLGREAQAPMGRGALAALMAAHPDRERTDDDGV